MAGILVVVTCVLYPLAVYAVGQLVFPATANGSFIRYDGRMIGSALIGQSFTSDRFFHSRPSASDYDATASGGTNLGPTSKKLRDGVAAAVKSFDVHVQVPADAVTSSGSGLDPDISPANAYAQSARVARAKGIDGEELRRLIDRSTAGRFLGVFGEPRVNVLRLNVAVAEMKRR